MTVRDCSAKPFEVGDSETGTNEKAELASLPDCIRLGAINVAQSRLFSLGRAVSVLLTNRTAD